MRKKTSVAAIIPAHNEAETIAPVVRAVVRSGMCSEVIVVADGCKDATAEVARAAGATRIIIRRRSSGKGAALRAGVCATRAPILLFLDADVQGLTRRHMRALLQPVLAGKVAMTVGLRDRGELLMHMGQYLPRIGGERALRRDIFTMVPQEFLAGYRIESALNYACHVRGLAMVTVPLHGLKIVTHLEKRGFFAAPGHYLTLAHHVVDAAVRVRVGRLRGAFPTL